MPKTLFRIVSVLLVFCIATDPLLAQEAPTVSDLLIITDTVASGAHLFVTQAFSPVAFDPINPIEKEPRIQAVKAQERLSAVLRGPDFLSYSRRPNQNKAKNPIDNQSKWYERIPENIMDATAARRGLREMRRDLDNESDFAHRHIPSEITRGFLKRYQSAVRNINDFASIPLDRSNGAELLEKEYRRLNAILVPEEKGKYISAFIGPYGSHRKLFRHLFSIKFAKRLKRDTLEAAAYIFVKLYDIHPFSDANTRTASLVMNWFLLKVGCEPVFLDKDNFREFRAIVKSFHDPANDSDVVRFRDFLAASPGGTSDIDMEWFAPLAWRYRSNEAVRAIRILSGLSHPVLPRVRENKETGDWETIWLEGVRLQDWIDEMSEMDDEQFLDALLPKVLFVARGLEVLHRANIVHGDVSAHKIILHGDGMVPTLIDWDQIGPSWGPSTDNNAMPELLRDAMIRRLNLSGSILMVDEPPDVFRKLEAACNAPSLSKPRFNREVLHLIEPRGLSNKDFINELRRYMNHHGESAQPMSIADPDAVTLASPTPKPDDSQKGGLIPKVTELFSPHLGGASSKRYRWAAGPAIEELIGFGSAPLAAAYGLHLWGIPDLMTLFVSIAVAAGARWFFYRFHPGRQRGAVGWIIGLNMLIPQLVAYHFSFSGTGILTAWLISFVLHCTVNIVNDTVVEYPLFQWWWYRAMLTLGHIIYRTSSEKLFLARIRSQVQRTRNEVIRDIQRLRRYGSLKVDVERDPEDPSAFEEPFIAASDGPPVLHVHFYHAKTNSMENGVNLYPASSMNEPYRLNTSHALVETGGSGRHFVDIPLPTDVQGVGRLEQKVLRESKKSRRFRRDFRWPEYILGRGVGREAAPLFAMKSRYDAVWQNRPGSFWTDPFSLVTFGRLDDLASGESVPSPNPLEEFQSILKAWAYEWDETKIPYQVLMPSVLQSGPWIDMIRLMPKSILLNLGLISPEAHALWPYPWDAKATKDIASWVRTVHRGRPLLVHGTREEFDELFKAMADRRNRFPMRRVSPSVLTNHSLERFFLILYQGLRLGGHPDDRMRLFNVFNVTYVFNLLKQFGSSHGLPLDWLENGRQHEDEKTLAAA